MQANTLSVVTAPRFTEYTTQPLDFLVACFTLNNGLPRPAVLTRDMITLRLFRDEGHGPTLDLISASLLYEQFPFGTDPYALARLIHDALNLTDPSLGFSDDVTLDGLKALLVYLHEHRARDVDAGLMQHAAMLREKADAVGRLALDVRCGKHAFDILTASTVTITALNDRVEALLEDGDGLLYVEAADSAAQNFGFARILTGRDRLIYARTCPYGSRPCPEFVNYTIGIEDVSGFPFNEHLDWCAAYLREVAESWSASPAWAMVR